MRERKSVRIALGERLKQTNLQTHSLRLAPNLCPSLTEEIFLKLKEEKIHNGIDLLSRDKEQLAAKIRVSYKVLQNICKVVNAYHGAFQVSGLDLYNETLKSCQIVSTGLKGLDNILGGGLLSEEIVEVFGCSGSGKSIFCLSISFHIALKERGSVTYIDPTRSINPAFIKQALATILPMNNPEEVKEALSHIHLYYPRDVWQLFALLEELSKDLETPPEDQKDELLGPATTGDDSKEGRRRQLLVLDSLPQLILPLIGGSQMDSFGVLNHLANLMRVFVRRKKSSLVVVNNATKVPEEDLTLTAQMKPILGRYWMHVPHTRLLLETIPRESSEKKFSRIHIVKSTRLKKASVEISL